MEILVTAGGTDEPIDGVRTISNFSTGKTGAVIADSFSKAGLKVTLLTSQRGVSPEEDIDIVRYTSFKDLDKSIREILSSRNITGVIHAAAVGDYSINYLESEGRLFEPSSRTKLDSTKPLTVVLKPNFKILEKIKHYNRRPIKVIGFKLTKNASAQLIKEKVMAQFSTKAVDFVVHNDLSLITKDTHISTIYKDGLVYKECKTKTELANELVEIFKDEARK